ncbi:hypothetical protein FKR81_19520 [Lentzea tibetensis]|uniref:Uncharacterized protein n=1 Tax=Lentzea tibetensis TaxID=2591470 RepID=A0A563ETG9_9PSEU|nr:hypothetical protein [Lentzea tibetensis]TWP50791.1 hypothetical protein FKR81_19520 [Lentzea tibetensis]
MSATQIPLWVTYSLAVIALVGPLGGAVIGGRVQAKRDDKRWERERDREELRYDREMTKLRNERDHDLLKLWHAARLDGHARMLYSLARWKTAAVTMIGRVELSAQDGRELSEDTFENVRKASVQIVENLPPVELYGSAKVRDAAERVHSQMSIFDLRMVTHLNKADFKTVQDAAFVLFDRAEELSTLIREDIGLLREEKR